MDVLARGWRAQWVISVFFIAFGVYGCEDPGVGRDLEGPSFQGNAPTNGPGIAPPSVEGSVCSMLWQTGCGVGQACVRSADGALQCVDSQGRAHGERCDASRVDECAAGTFCIVGTDGARCQQLCVENTIACVEDVVCEFVVANEGVRIGVCAVNLDAN